MSNSTGPQARISSAWGAGAAESKDAVAHFASKLSCETDPSDVHADLGKGIDTFVIVDARSEKDFLECHLPNAINLPHRRITEETTAFFSKERLVVVYCWGPGCNASTRAALKFAELGFPVKEMIGGIEYWRREGFEVEGSNPEGAPLVG